MELAVDLIAGESTAELEALVEEHKSMVYRIAYSVLRNHHDAEDAAQEAFLKVWRAGSKLPQVIDRKGWIARIAWNAATDRARQRRPAGDAELDNLAHGVANAEQLAAGAELQRLLEALIAGLPPKLREVLVLSTVEELEHAEIGAVLRLDAAAVRMRLFQARKLLKEKLERHLGKANE